MPEAQQPAADAKWRTEPWAAAAEQAMELGREHGDIADALALFEVREPEEAIDMLASLVNQKRLWATPYEKAVSVSECSSINAEVRPGPSLALPSAKEVPSAGAFPLALI